MHRLCIVCYRWRKSSTPKICVECRDQLTQGIQDDYTIGLFHYQNSIRDLIRRGKIQGDLPAISLLITLFLAARETQNLAEWCEVIVPAPSSLWGRLRGKFDIAFELSSKLATEYAKPLENPPNCLYWRFRKRSQQHHLASPDIARNPVNPLGRRRVLIIDDVTTTGQTLHEIAAFYPDDYTKFLTLASATSQATAHESV
jgi:predicted amidophosphoribosyltransferase